jgi:ribosomal protein S18 acetylase RimI-like enzyme
MAAIEIRAAAGDDDAGWIVQAARDVLGSEYQVHSQRQFVVTDVDVLIAERSTERIGFLAWEQQDDTCETLAIACTRRGEGAGTALMETLHRLAAERGCTRVKVITTDTNHGARRFYERLGYEVAAIREGAVDECRRRYKPELPPDMHDEIEYRRSVAPRTVY